MTDDQAVPLPPSAVVAFDPVRERAWADWHSEALAPWLDGSQSPDDISHEAYSTGYEAGRAQGAATERKNWTARVHASRVNLTRPRFTASGQVTEAWIPLSALADLLDGTP